MGEPPNMGTWEELQNSTVPGPPTILKSYSRAEHIKVENLSKSKGFPANVD